jgi:hypothetical protein
MHAGIAEHFWTRGQRTGPLDSQKAKEKTFQDGTIRAVTGLMPPSTPLSSPLHGVCPHCASDQLIFLERGSGVTVFQCDSCARATVLRWDTPSEPVAKRPSEKFTFPSWFTGVSER